jgi:molybdenum cofactor cytidylyltransferase
VLTGEPEGGCRVAGLVLGAGEATRFGGVKQVAPLGGKPLIAHAVAAQTGVATIERVVAVVGAHHELVRAALPDAADVVPCRDWQEGISASIRAGVGALRGAEWVVVTLADQPRISPEMVVASVAAIDPRRHGRRRAM